MIRQRNESLTDSRGFQVFSVSPMMFYPNAINTFRQLLTYKIQAFLGLSLKKILWMCLRNAGYPKIGYEFQNISSPQKNSFLIQFFHTPFGMSPVALEKC